MSDFEKDRCHLYQHRTHLVDLCCVHGAKAVGGEVAKEASAPVNILQTHHTCAFHLLQSLPFLTVIVHIQPSAILQGSPRVHSGMHGAARVTFIVLSRLCVSYLYKQSKAAAWGVHLPAERPGRRP